MSSQSGHEFATLLRRHRLLGGLSQEALAERAGLSVRGISDLERGVRRAPYPATIARLADALGLDEPAREALLLAATAGPSIAPRPPIVPESPPHDAPRAAVAIEERRWVTVLAVQLGGFSALAARLDPEDLRQVAESCAERIASDIRRFGGTILQSTGETSLAVFGAPVAHEDDAERALRSGLAIRAARLPIPDGESVQVRIGVETGEVLAGPRGHDGQQHYAVSGAPVSVAVGLATGSATANVLVAEHTYRATYQRVRYQVAPPVQDKDWPQPLSAWEALDVAPAPQSRSLGNAPFVGRDQELDTLLTALARVVREHRPHLVSVLGEPGIGKSRLIAEFERRATAATDLRLLHGRCLPYGEVVGYQAMSMALDELAGIAPELAVDEARARLDAVVRDALHTSTVTEIEQHLALLCGLDTETDRQRGAPDQRSMHVSVRRFLEALARERPVCLLVEDLHWGDDALLGLLEHIAERAVDVPLLIVTQARPELLERRPTWGGGVRGYTSVSLEPIDPDAGLTLAEALCRERGLSATNANRISVLAGGNPLFAEELSAAMVEGGETGGVPSALRALISARLDALPAEEKRALQHAAVLGKHVWQSALAALDVGGDLLEQLEALARRDLLRSQPGSRFGGQREYAFKHDLIQEMAYGLLPRSERRRLHARIVGWLEDNAGERADQILDLLAHHAVNAELHERALDYLARGAERSSRSAAHREEAALLDQAIAIAERTGRDDLVPELRARRGRALTRVTLWADARRELEAALAGLPEEHTERRAEVLLDLALACNWTMDDTTMRLRATQALEVAKSVGRTDLAIDARFWLAWATGSAGDTSSSIDQYLRAVDDSTRLGVALAPSVLPLYSTALCWAGSYETAVERSRAAVRIAREAQNTDSTILALQVLGLALAGSGAYDEAWHVFDEAARFGREYGIGPFLARSIAMSAGFHLDVYDYPGHLALAEEASDLARSIGFQPSLISASLDTLFNFARQGQIDRAHVIASEVAEVIARAPSWHGWLWRLRFAQAQAEVALARNDMERSMVLADAALQQARGRRPKYEVLALTTRSAVLARTGRTREAMTDLQAAIRVARSVGDPALFVRSAAALLAIDGNDALADEARGVAQHIVANLPNDQMRARFQSAELVRGLGPLVPIRGSE